MNTKEAAQKKVHEFLRDRWLSQESFTKKDLKDYSEWSDSSFNTYFSKQLNGLLRNVGTDRYQVRHLFRRFIQWKDFKWGVVSQKRNYGRIYSQSHHGCVVNFEFFMPLRNEEWLRSALDGLFYSEHLLNRLRAIPTGKVEKHFPKNSSVSSEAYERNVTEWISDRFIGYSILHVSGRFRAQKLKTKAEAAQVELKDGLRYLVDETTAVVRFIIPCGNPNGDRDVAAKEAEVVRWVFDQFFVQTMLEFTDGEDEVWLMESGYRNELHIFRST